MPDTIAAGEENVLETAVHDIETARNTYYIIVASLPSKQMAEKQIECFHRQGVSADLQIYETARKSRLYVASFDDFDEGSSISFSFGTGAASFCECMDYEGGKLRVPLGYLGRKILF